MFHATSKFCYLRLSILKLLWARAAQSKHTLNSKDSSYDVFDFLHFVIQPDP